MLDQTTAIATVGVAAGVVVDAYVLGVRVVRKELRDEGVAFAEKHLKACQSLVKGASIGLATKLSKSEAVQSLLAHPVAPPTGTEPAAIEDPKFAVAVGEIESLIADYRKNSHVHDRLFEVRDGYENLGNLAHIGWTLVLGAGFLSALAFVLNDQGFPAAAIISGIVIVYLVTIALYEAWRWVRLSPKVEETKRQLDKDLRERHYFPTSGGTANLASPPAVP